MQVTNTTATTATTVFFDGAIASDSAEQKAAPAASQALPDPGIGNDASAVKVSLSAAALAYTNQTDALPSDDGETNYGVYFFPTRAGYNAAALAEAVTNPEAQSSSAGKTLDQAAAAARASMDAKYAAMQASGKPFDMNSPEGVDWYALMGDLDRRSLLAIRENVGKQFTKNEQDLAQSIMTSQQGLAMGFYEGPISQESKFHDQFMGDEVARYKATLAWMDKASTEEKQTSDWIQQRMVVENALHQTKKDDKLPKMKSLLEYMLEWSVKYEEQQRQREKDKQLAPSAGGAGVGSDVSTTAA